MITFFNSVSLDLRSLALLRICLALLVLYDLFDRHADLLAHYTDLGVLNRLSLLQLFAQPHHVLWPHLLVGSLWTVQFLFILHALLAALWLLGWRSRVVGPAVWLLHCSLQIRNPLVNHGGDQMLHCLLFWTMFLPLNRHFAFDAISRSSSADDVRLSRMPSSESETTESQSSENDHDTSDIDRPVRPFVSLFGFALLLQVALVYSVSFVHKSAPHWFPHGTATEMALGLDYFRTPLGSLILALPTPLLRYTTLLVWLFEGFGPLLYFLPFQSTRLLGCVGFAVMHLMFGSSLRLGIFALVGIVAQIGFLPPLVWRPLERWLARRRRANRNLVVAFDANCDVCARRTDAYARLLCARSCAVAPPAGAAAPRRRLPWVIDRQSRAEVVLLPQWLTWLAGLAHRHRGHVYRGAPVRDDEPPTALDDVVTANRMLATNGAALALIALSVLVNLDSLGTYPLPPSLAPLVGALHLDQHWAMFAPHPPTDQFWYSMPAETIGGTRLELFQRGGLRRWRGTAAAEVDASARPSGDDMFASIGNQRWFKYFENGINGSPHNMALRLEFGRWICREYNRARAPAEQLYTFELRLHIERIRVRDDPLEQPQLPAFGPQVLSMHKCFDSRDAVNDWPPPANDGGRAVNDRTEL